MEITAFAGRDDRVASTRVTYILSGTDGLGIKKMRIEENRGGSSDKGLTWGEGIATRPMTVPNAKRPACRLFQSN
jgi:hypothetical protein